MARKGVVNGVDVDRLCETVEAVRKTPGVAAFRFRCENQWIEGGHTRGRASSFDGVGEANCPRPATFVFESDEPPVLLGKDKGANPVEYLLAALSACVTTTIVYHAANRGIRINGIRSRIEGDIDLRGFLGLDPTIRCGFKEIRMSVDLDADAPVEQLEEIVKLGPTYSPVFDSVRNGVPVHVRLGERVGRKSA